MPAGKHQIMLAKGFTRSCNLEYLSQPMSERNNSAHVSKVCTTRPMLAESPTHDG